MKFFKILLFLFWLSFTACTVNATDQGAEKRDIALPGGKMVVYFESFFTPKEKIKLMRWLHDSATGITTLYGQFPVKQVNVHLYALRGADEPVPWGEVWKNEGYLVNFQVNPGFSLQQFLNDWTAPHELSHLLHPYPGQGNSWFGEGLASYYQNILRMRQGFLSEEQGWQKLLEGFQRGTRQASFSQLSLVQASQNMRSGNHYQHVYWGGAAYFLAVDVALRQATQGRESLDTAWSKFRQCCLSYSKDWSVIELTQKLDQLTATTIFTNYYNKMLHRKKFPDYQSSFLALNIGIDGGKVHLDNRPSTALTLRNWLITANNLK